jgi:hypothetical protein
VASAGEGGNPLTQQCIWFVGVNRFGYAYCMLFDAGTDAFLGYVPISGRIALHEGDNQLVVVLERQDTSGRYICDLENLKVQVGYRNVTRWHLGPVPGGPF